MERQSIWKSSYDGGTFSEIIGGYRFKQQDENRLQRLGKKQELKRRFGLLSMFGFSCTILVTWETTLAVFQEGFVNGGPAGIIWGFPLAWCLSTSVYMCLAEMASIAPIAGGQYFWVAILAPPRCKKFLSYMTGWLTTLAWIATIATGMVLVGDMIQGLIILNNPNYTAKSWQETIYAWVIVLISVIVNTLIAGLLPFFEGFILIIHVLGFVAVVITLVYLSPHVPASEVYFRALNEGNWPTQALSFLVGFIGNVSTFVGADAAVHMSEEIENAAKNVPMAMLTTLILNGILGYGMLTAVLFCLTDIQAVENTDTGIAFIQVFADGTGIAGATIMTSIVIALCWCAVIGFIATASRMLWSFARDKGVPFHRTIRKVDERSSIPIYAILIVSIIPVLISLINIASEFAYDNVISMSVSGLYLSYLIPCSLLLWRRLTKQIKPYNSDEFASTKIVESSDDSSIASGDSMVEIPLMWGPWRIPGILGDINNIVGCLYCVYVIFWSFWPPEYPATADTMNYAVASTGFVVICSVLYYFIKGRKEYVGPLLELIKAEK